MLYAAVSITLIWLLLYVSGMRGIQLPNEQLAIRIAHLKQEAKERHQAAMGKVPQQAKVGKSSEPAAMDKLGKKTRKARKAKPIKPTSKLIYAPAYVLYEKLKLEQRAPMLLHMLHSYMMQYHRYQWSFEATVFMLNEAIGGALLVLVAGSWLAYALNENAIAFVAAAVSIVVVLQLYQGTKNSLAQRKRAMLMELPKLLTQLTLLVGAGDSVQQSFTKSIKNKQQSKHPLYVEWNEAVFELSNGASFATVVEKLNRNCALQQMSMLTTILLLNYRKGGEHFINSVQELNMSLWESRKTIARLKGEEASSKMIFPLVGILFLVMVLVVAPAIFMMQIM